MVLLDQKDSSWKTFQAMTRNFTPLKSLMNSVKPEELTQEQLNLLMPVWKNFSFLQSKLQRLQPALVLLEWISSTVEYKLKKDTLTASKIRLPELDRKVKLHLAKIAQINAEILTYEEKIAEVKLSIEQGEHEEITNELSKFSRSTSLSGCEERAVSSTPLHHGTASGGLMESTKPMFEFPDFESHPEELYENKLGNKDSEEDQLSIILEGNDGLGCCGIKFCFM